MKKRCLGTLVPLFLFTTFATSLISCGEQVQEVETLGTLTVVGDLEHASVKIVGLNKKGEIFKGAEIKVNLKIDTGYKLSKLTVNDIDISLTKSFIINNPFRNYEIKVLLEKDDQLPNPNPDPTPDPEPDPDPNPDLPKYDEEKDGVGFNYQTSFVVEKIYDEKYLGGNYDYSFVNKRDFYNSSFERAITYNDAGARTEACLLSGDFKTPKNIANYNNVSNPEDKNGNVFYNARARYIYNTPDFRNPPIGYIINDTDGDDSNDDVIFRNGAYTSMDDVSAYMFAFNDAPLNWCKGKSGSDENKMIKKWGEFGRVNNAYFSGDVSRYPYEPLLTGINDKFSYKEADFGTDGDFLFYTQDDSHNMKPQKPYFDGDTIHRGVCRFCYTFENKNRTDIEIDGERHIFYTRSHYNDFEEYLNYKGGYGKIFGNLAVGNQYNDKTPDKPVSKPGEYKLATFHY